VRGYGGFCDLHLDLLFLYKLLMKLLFLAKCTDSIFYVFVLGTVLAATIFLTLNSLSYMFTGSLYK
jgi:hypothetical protein